MSRSSFTPQFQLAVLALLGPCPPGCDLMELRRTQLVKAEALLSRVRPFAVLGKGPPRRNPGEPPLRVSWSSIGPAMLALLHFGTLSLHIHGAYHSSSTSWQHLTPYIPVVIDWLEYVHPSNGHIEVIPTAGACCTPNVVLSVLRGLCKPGLHGEDTPSTKTCGFLSQTPVLSWLLDLWLDFDLGDYNASIQEDFIQQIIIQLCKFAYGDYHPPPGRHLSDPPSETMQLPYELLALIRQKIGRRKLCHVISRWAEALQERPDDEGCAKAFFLFALSLLTVPELLPKVYPREALKRLLRCLDRHLSLGHYDTVATGFVYLECIWIAAMDHRTLQ
ncbi:hypothetical protein GGF50DRAFT_111228 [Schizophyllum commune]